MKTINLILIVAVAFFADRAVRVENVRYAMDLRMCTHELSEKVGFPMWDFRCLDEVETRTSWIFHRLYVITEPQGRVELW